MAKFKLVENPIPRPFNYPVSDGKPGSTSDIMLTRGSLIPRLSPAPVFDRLQYAKTEPTASDQKPEPRKARQGAKQG